MLRVFANSLANFRFSCCICSARTMSSSTLRSMVISVSRPSTSISSRIRVLSSSETASSVCRSITCSSSCVIISPRRFNSAFDRFSSKLILITCRSPLTLPMLLLPAGDLSVSVVSPSPCIVIDAVRVPVCLLEFIVSASSDIVNPETLTGLDSSPLRSCSSAIPTTDTWVPPAAPLSSPSLGWSKGFASSSLKFTPSTGIKGSPVGMCKPIKSFIMELLLCPVTRSSTPGAPAGDECCECSISAPKSSCCGSDMLLSQ